MTEINTRIVEINRDEISLAAALIRAGELVAFPTETVYGLGADALNPTAVEKIFIAKGRPADNPLIVHIAHPEDAATLYEETEVARKLAAAFWPGPLTIVLPAKESVPLITRGGLKSVAVRCPSSVIARDLIEASGKFIAAPSANRSKRPSPTTAQAVFEDMDGRIPLILDGGSCQIGLESTVVTLCDAVPRILRPGGVTLEMLQDVLDEVEVDPAVMNGLAPDAQAASPGMKYRHYAPKGEMTILTGEHIEQALCCLYDRAVDNGKKPVILYHGDAEERLGARETIFLGNRLEEIAARFYTALIDADRAGYDTILSSATSGDDLGLAIMNRMLRAAAFKVIPAAQVLEIESN